MRIFSYKSVRVEWKLPARRDDIIIVNRIISPEAVYFELLNQNGKVCTILEFS